MKRSHQEVVHQVLRALEVHRRAVGLQRLGWYADPYSPEAGDLEQGHTLPAYRELAHVLEPWLYLKPHSDEALRRWERRFLD